MTECPECGARNARSATFCVRCGAELPALDARQSPGEDTDRLTPTAGAMREQEASAEAGQEPEQTVADAVTQQPAAAPATESARAADRLLREATDLLAGGDASTAAARCREAIELAPDMVAAYSLLGMAEEQRGNTVAAAGAYRRVLQLDPERRVEREKLEALYALGATSRPADVDEADELPILRYAPWGAAVGAAFLVLTILTAVGLRVHQGHRAERVYAEQMAAAQEALDGGDYRAAADAFEIALNVKPGDRDAARGLSYAKRKLGAGTMLSAVGSGAVARPMPRTARVVPSPGPNPFQPVPIGGTSPDEEPQAPTRARRAPRPPVISTEPVVVGGQQQGTAGEPAPEALPFSPLETGEEETEEPEPEPEPAERVAAVQEPERRGEFSIWFGDAGQESPAEEQPRPTPGHADRAGDLRRQAEQARARGDCERAAELYGEAIDAYRADSEQNPANRDANDAAVRSCESARDVCVATEGQ